MGLGLNEMAGSGLGRSDGSFPSKFKRYAQRSGAGRCGLHRIPAAIMIRVPGLEVPLSHQLSHESWIVFIAHLVDESGNRRGLRIGCSRRFLDVRFELEADIQASRRDCTQVRQAGIDPILTGRSKCFEVYLSGGYIGALQIGLDLRHEFCWPTEKIVSFDVVYQPLQQVSGNVTHTVEMDAGPVFFARSTVGNVQADIRPVPHEVANFSCQRVMAAIACAVDEPHPPVAVLRSGGMQNAHHWCHTDTSADEDQRACVARHHEITGRSPAGNDGTCFDLVVKITGCQPLLLALDGNSVARVSWRPGQRVGSPDPVVDTRNVEFDRQVLPRLKCGKRSTISCFKDE